MRTPFLILVASAAASLAACSPPVNNTPVEQVPQLASVEELMDVQATVADPQFKKIDAASYADADYASFAALGQKLDATSKKLKDFKRGAEFDGFAQRLNDGAGALSKAAAAKDAAASKAALTGIKAACKDCHSKFK